MSSDNLKCNFIILPNGQWAISDKSEENKVEKSGYGPKGYGLYDPTVNAKRKENNTGESVENAGRNKNVKEYTSATQGTAKVQAKALADKQAKLNARQPVKTEIPPELKAKLEAEANKPKDRKP